MKLCVFLIAMFAAAAQSQVTDDERKANCDLFQGTIEKVTLRYGNQFINATSKNLCIATFGLEDRPIALDADFLGPYKRSVANSLKTLIYIHGVVFQQAIGSIYVTYICETVLRGTKVAAISPAVVPGFIPGLVLKTANGTILPRCTLLDGSAVEPQNVWYSSMANLKADRHTTLAVAKERDPEEMRLFLGELSDEYVIPPVEFHTCSISAHCPQNQADPCTGEETSSKFVCAEGLCVVEAQDCESNDDCTGFSVLKSYGYADGQYDHYSNNVGFCVTQSCVENKCVADLDYL